MSEKLGKSSPGDQKLSSLAGLGIVVLWVVSIVLPFEFGKIAESQILVFVLLAFSIPAVFVFSLLWSPRFPRVTLAIAAGTGLVFSLLGYVAAQRFSSGETLPPDFVLLFSGQSFVLLVGLLPYLQSRLSTGSWSWTATEIFTYASDNGLTLYCGAMATVLIFVGTSVARATGWGSLTVFLHQEATPFLILTIGFGLIIALLRMAPSALSKLRSKAGKLARFSVIALLLCGTGLLTIVLAIGIEAFSEVITATTILSILAALGVLLTNASVNDDRLTKTKATLSGSATRLLQPLLVALAVMACYALYLRIAQYGLTPNRAVMAYAAGTLLLYCLGGLVSVIFWRQWAEVCRRTRSLVTLSAAGVVAVSLTPIADPFVLSAASQYRLLASGSVAIADYDFRYLERKLGNPGRQTLARLRRHPGELQAAEINRKIDELQRPYPFESKVALTFASLEKVTAETFKDTSRIILVPDNLPLPNLLQGNSLGPFVSKASCALEDGPGCLVTAIDLTDGDGLEYLIALRKSDAISELWMLERHGTRVQQTRLLQPNSKLEKWDELVSGEFAAVPANHFDLRIGDEVIHLRERRWFR